MPNFKWSFCSSVSPEVLGFLTAIGLFIILMTFLFWYLNNKLALENSGSLQCLDDFRKKAELQGESAFSIRVPFLFKVPKANFTMFYCFVLFFYKTWVFFNCTFIAPHQCLKLSLDRFHVSVVVATTLSGNSSLHVFFSDMFHTVVHYYLTVNATRTWAPLIVQILNPTRMDQRHRLNLRAWPPHGGIVHQAVAFSRSHVGITVADRCGLVYLSSQSLRCSKGWWPWGACTGSWLDPEEPPGKSSKGRRCEVVRAIYATWNRNFGTIMLIFLLLCDIRIQYSNKYAILSVPKLLLFLQFFW